MKYLLDTNVISEMFKQNCDQNVLNFLDFIGLENSYISAFTFGEICYGVEKLSASKKKHDLPRWLYFKIPQLFNSRIVPLDTDVFIEWGRLRAKAKGAISYDDSFLAASAIFHNMTLVTRNIKDFESVEGIKLINPFLGV